MPVSDFPAQPYMRDDGEYRSLYFDDEAIQSVMRNAAPAALELEYTRMMMGFLLFNPAPASIAFIGLGGGSLVKFCYHHLPHTQLRVAENNHHVLAMRDLFAIPADDHRLSIQLADGVDFIASQRALDVLLVDGYDRSGLPARLSSIKFYRACARAMSPKGIAVFNLLPAALDFPQQCADIAAAFGHCQIFTDLEACNNVAIAQRTAIAISDIAIPVEWSGAVALRSTLDRMQSDGQSI